MSAEKPMIFFATGNIVRINKKLPHCPLMMVKHVVKFEDLKTNKKTFAGIKCFWFTETGLYQEQIFSSKDLELVVE